MAREDTDKDDVESGEKKGSTMVKIAIGFFAAVMLIGASVGTTLLISSSLGQGGASVAAVDDQGAKKEAKGSHGNGDKDEPIYVKLGDPFVVNFVEGNQIRYLQVAIEAMTRTASMQEKIETHMPVIRNNLVMLFSSLDYNTISSVAGKQKIRDESLAEVQSILQEQTGEPGVEALYFTSFVMQ